MKNDQHHTLRNDYSESQKCNLQAYFKCQAGKHVPNWPVGPVVKTTIIQKALGRCNDKVIPARQLNVPHIMTPELPLAYVLIKFVQYNEI